MAKVEDARMAATATASSCCCCDLPEHKASAFRGPAQAACKPLAGCCISGNPQRLAGSIPTDFEYILPLGLHMCLCPQQGCDPTPTLNSRDKKWTACKQNVAANLCGLCIQNSNGQITLYACCWRWACCYCKETVACAEKLMLPFCLPVLCLVVEGR